MTYLPKENEERMLKVLNAWKTLAPALTFAGVSLAEFETQINNSFIHRDLSKTFKNHNPHRTMPRVAVDAAATKNNILSNTVIASPARANIAIYNVSGCLCEDSDKSGFTHNKAQTTV